MAYLHDEKRILHRDVKSSNIFLTSGLVKLGDFGIARLLDTEDRATTLAGTPHYMSPEALSGDGYDAKSDVWALGCIVYELCALKKPFRGSSLVGVSIPYHQSVPDILVPHDPLAGHSEYL